MIAFRNFIIPGIMYWSEAWRITLHPNTCMPVLIHTDWSTSCLQDTHSSEVIKGLNIGWKYIDWNYYISHLSVASWCQQRRCCAFAPTVRNGKIPDSLLLPYISVYFLPFLLFQGYRPNKIEIKSLACWDCPFGLAGVVVLINWRCGDKPSDDFIFTRLKSACSFTAWTWH